MQGDAVPKDRHFFNLFIAASRLSTVHSIRRFIA